MRNLGERWTRNPDGTTHKIPADMSFEGWKKQFMESEKAPAVKTADYLWRGKLWDLKTVTTEKAANFAVRKGMKQIRENPGGIILDYRGASIDLDVLAEVIKKRLQWRKEQFAMDIMIILDGQVLVWRY